MGEKMLREDALTTPIHPKLTSPHCALLWSNGASRSRMPVHRSLALPRRLALLAGEIFFFTPSGTCPPSSTSPANSTTIPSGILPALNALGRVKALV